MLEKAVLIIRRENFDKMHEVMTNDRMYYITTTKVMKTIHRTQDMEANARSTLTASRLPILQFEHVG